MFSVFFAYTQARQTAVIFSDHDINHENVSPLQFGDFNDDILQLMKEEENRIDDDIPNGQPSIDSVAGNCTNTFENVNYQTVNNDYNQLKPNIQTPMMSSKSDPAYASAHRTTIPTESHEVRFKLVCFFYAFVYRLSKFSIQSIIN